MVKFTLYNHYLIRIYSLAVDMNNTDEASLYCRRLELITFVENVDYVQQYFSGKRTKPYCSTCVAVADFLLHRGVACRM
jgi:hypothetical protein